MTTTNNVVWDIPQAYGYFVLRQNAQVEADRSVFFTSDRVAIRATLRVGFGFPTRPPSPRSRPPNYDDDTQAPQLTQDTSTGSVKVVEPHLVYHDGEQRSGVLTDVPADTFAHWERHGWVTINDKPTPPKEPTSEK